MIKVCPHCNRRYMVNPGTTDFIHECNSGNNAIDQEDVVVVGNWEDFSGSGNVPKQQVTMQGVENELEGKRAGIEGERKHKETRRGKTATTHRQRQHFQFINLKGEN